MTVESSRLDLRSWSDALPDPRGDTRAARRVEQITMRERDRKDGSTFSQTESEQPVRAAALPIVALWVPALGVEVTIPQRAGELTIGSAPECDVVLNHNQVSRRHAVAEHRSGGALEIRDLGSKNGIEYNGTKRKRVEVQEGKHIKLGSLRVLTLTEPMRVARRRLAFYLGFAAPAAELAVAAAAADTPCLVLAEGRGSDVTAVARSYAMASPRCDGPFEIFDAPVPSLELEARVAAARRGVAFVDGGKVDPMPSAERARLIALLMSPTANTMLIYGAPKPDFAARLGHDRLLYMHKARIPTVADRILAHELPQLLDHAFERIGVGFTHRDLDLPPSGRRGAGGTPNLDRLRKYDWPDNYDELRLCAIYVKGKLTNATERQIAEEMGRSRGGMISLARRWALDFGGAH